MSLHTISNTHLSLSLSLIFCVLYLIFSCFHVCHCFYLLSLNFPHVVPRPSSRLVSSIDLRWNNLGSVGGRAISDALLHNHTIKSILVTGNKIPQDIVKKIGKLDRLRWRKKAKKKD